MARVHSALEGLQGVIKVEFLTAPDRYIVDYDPAQVGYEDFVRTFNSQVAGRMFRGMLGKLGGEQSGTLCGTQHNITIQFKGINRQMAYQPENLTVYVTSWCSDSLRTLRFLDIHEIKYQAVDIDQDEDAEELVRRINNGMRSVPTLDIDGRYLTEPSSRELREVFNIA